MLIGLNSVLRDLGKAVASPLWQQSSWFRGSCSNNSSDRNVFMPIMCFFFLRFISRNEINTQKAETFLWFLIGMSLGYLKWFLLLILVLSLCLDADENLLKKLLIFIFPFCWSPNVFILPESGSSHLLQYFSLQMHNVSRKWTSFICSF